QEAKDDFAEGNAAWRSLYPSLPDPLPGIMVLNYRRVTCGNGDIGITPPVTSRTSPHVGTYQSFMCTAPRGIQSFDPPLWSAVTDLETCLNGGQECVTGPVGFGVTLGVRTLAHELGHALTLLHGNGADDDLDSAYPPNPGPRSYDGGINQGSP